MLFVSSEIALVLGVVITIILILFLKRRKKKETVARNLVKDYKEKQDEKRENLRLLMTEVFQMQEEEADNNTETLSEAERQLFTHILKIYLDKDTDCIHEIESDIRRLVQGYHTIASGKVCATPTTGGNQGEIEELNARVSVLNDEKERLQDELKIALESIDNIMKEYATMYSGGGEFNREDTERLKKMAEDAARITGITKSAEENDDTEMPADTETPEPVDEVPSDAIEVGKAQPDHADKNPEDDPGFDSDAVPDIDLEPDQAVEAAADETRTDKPG
jgi:hypothetical protein